MKKFLVSLLCLSLLTGCTLSVKNRTDDNTTSNITESTTAQSTTASTTETPTAEAVISLDSLSTSKVIWGPGAITEHKQPSDPISLQKKFSSLNAKWLLDDEKNIALTFDEGYENGFTPSILDTLKEKNVKAVFFVTYDFAKDNPKLIQRMIDEGHTVGNHSYHHYSMDELDTDTAKEEISFLHDYIKKEYNYTMSYFRFPKGEFSEKSLGIAKELGYKSIFWSYAYADWDTSAQPDESTAFVNICNSTHDGEIMLLHAVSKTNANILGKVIDDVRKQGYKFTTNI